MNKLANLQFAEEYLRVHRLFSKFLLMKRKNDILDINVTCLKHCWCYHRNVKIRQDKIRSTLFNPTKGK